MMANETISGWKKNETSEKTSGLAHIYKKLWIKLKRASISR